MRVRLHSYMSAYGELIRLGLPILAGQLGMILASFADNIMVGHYSTPSLASASFVNNLFNVAILCALGFGYGLTPLAGALFGRREYHGIGRLTRQALYINIVYVLIVMGIMGMVYFNLHRLGQPAELLPLIRPYYLTVLASMLPMVAYNVLMQWCYAINKTGLPTWILLGANMLNVLGNYILIYGAWGAPELGLLGAGYSTLLCRTLGPLVLGCYLLMAKGARPYKEGFLHGKPRPSDNSLIWRTSLPVSLQMTFESGSFTCAAVIVGWLGAIPLAAFQVCIVVGMLGFTLYYGVGSAISIKVANAAGTADRGLMRHYAWAGYHLMLVLMAVASLIFWLGGSQLMHLFSNDEAVVMLALSLIPPLILYQLGDATQIAFANALRGTSHVMPMLWIAFVSYVVIGIPATYWMAIPAGMGTYGVILSFSVSLFVAGGAFLYYFLRVTHKQRCSAN